MCVCVCVLLVEWALFERRQDSIAVIPFLSLSKWTKNETQTIVNWTNAFICTKNLDNERKTPTIPCRLIDLVDVNRLNIDFNAIGNVREKKIIIGRLYLFRLVVDGRLFCVFACSYIKKNEQHKRQQRWRRRRHLLLCVLCQCPFYKCTADILGTPIQRTILN